MIKNNRGGKLFSADSRGSHAECEKAGEELYKKAQAWGEWDLIFNMEECMGDFESPYILVYSQSHIQFLVRR